MFFIFLIASSLLFGQPESVGVYAVHMPSGKVLMDENSDRSLMPASCLKIVTTGAALHLLGPESCFQTELQYDGALEKGILQGNVYIRGGGDPCLGSERIPSSLSWRGQIDVWVDAIQKKGIKSIEGKVVGDASRWEKALAVPSWAWEDLGNYYGAGASALSFHENSYTLFFQPGEMIGEKTQILRTDPEIAHVELQNEVSTGPEGSGDRACIYGTEFSTKQMIRGTIPLGVREFSIKGSIPNPADFTALLLTQALQKKGIVVKSKESKADEKRVTFHSMNSPALKDIVFWINQKSINLYAEHLVKKMGEVVYGEGSTEAGVKAITQFWKSQKIDLDGFHMVDGSGLSRKNLITPKQCVEILLKMKQSEFFPLFFKSLPRKSDKIYAKSGSMSLVKGYVGYAGDIAFAILVNQCTDHEKMKAIIDAFFKSITSLKEL